MTEKEYNNWLSTLEVNCEVCITNLWDIQKDEISDFWVSYDEHHVCIISKVRGILEDGSIVVSNDIFNSSNGVLEYYQKSQEHIPMLCPVNDDLRRISWRHNFYNHINQIEWELLYDETIIGIIDLLNNDIAKKEEQNKE